MDAMPMVDESVLRQAMAAAIDVASDPTIHTGTNPRVGCTLLSETGVVLATAAHHGPGTPHAEVAALEQVAEQGDSEKLRGGIAVVTLEPCNHFGTTPPCAKALARAGVKRVYFGVTDPNPEAAGGANYLRGRGVSVHPSFMSTEALKVDHRWVGAMNLARPHVTLKVAMTLDGRIAATDGSSQWITGLGARMRGQQLRLEHDAVMVGTGTALTDDPQLCARDHNGYPLDRSIQPKRVVVGHRTIPQTAKVCDDTAETLFVGHHGPQSAMQTLWGYGVRRVLLEGGATIATAYLKAGCVDEIRAFVAPVLLGSGKSWLGDLGITTLEDAQQWITTDVEIYEPDVCLTMFPADRRR